MAKGIAGSFFKGTAMACEANSALLGAAANWERYSSKAQGTEEEKRLRGEVGKRLKQLRWLLQEVFTREQGCQFSSTALSGYVFNRFEEQDLITELQEANCFRNLPPDEHVETMAESFYVFASRVRSIVRMIDGFKSFEATGVRDVRNHLILHPEGNSSKIYSFGFGLGGPNGPVLGLRLNHDPQSFKDKGLYWNAKEFGEALEAKTIRAISELD